MPDELPPEWPAIVVPDDARELDADRAALLHERRVAARRQRWGRVFMTRRWRRYGLSGPLVAAVLVVVTGFGSLMVLLAPSRPPRLQQAPLAAPGPGPGTTGGLLPDLSVRTAGGDTVALRSVRPAVVAMVPLDCRCPGDVAAVARQARLAGVPLVVTGPGPQPPEVPGGARGGRTRAAVEPSGRLATAYAAPLDRLTTLLVAADGVVVRVLRDPAAGTALQLELQRLHATR